MKSKTAATIGLLPTLFGRIEAAAVPGEGGGRMAFLLGSMRRRAGLLIIALTVLSSGPALAGTVKIGTLKFGTVNWELDVIKTNGLDKAAGLDLEIVDLASAGATTVALQAGSVDVI